MSWKKILNSLANGIETRLYIHSHLSDITIEHTMALARSLKIPEEVIISWSQERRAQVELHKKDIESLLNKLSKDAVARNILSNFTLYKKENNDGSN